MFFRTLAATAILTVSVFAQQPAAPTVPVPSPPTTASVMLDGQQFTINYGAPSMRNRKVMGGIVPFNQVWRTGANDATSFVIGTDVMIGDLAVRAGTYTLYTLPNADSGKWMLVINKQTKQWGTEYHPEQDLGRTLMQHATLPAPQETMSISFEKRSGDGKSVELHVRWESTDEWVKITAK